MKQQKRTGVLFIAFPLLLQIPFTLLSIHYDYPDILREPAGVILQKYQAGGPGLIALWYVYALSILIFVGALLNYASVRGSPKLESALQFIGLFSASVQFIALLRWTFVVPFLAEFHAAATTAQARQFIEMVFTLQHNFLGVGLGEHIGQLTLLLWTSLMVYDQVEFPKPIRWLGLSAALILALGLIEHLSLVFGFPAGIFAHGSLLGFILWSLWLIAVGVRLIRSKG